MSDLDRTLATIAARQRLLITIRDVYAAGGSAANADDRVRGGRWQRVDRGVYLIAGASWDWPTQQLAAVLAAGPGAAASHLAAARLWDLPGFAKASLEVSIPRGRRYRRPGVRTHESTDLDRCAIVQRDGVPVTDADRTLLDLGRYVGRQRLDRAIEAARRAGHVSWSSLTATLAVHARRGRPGVRRLRGVILSSAHREEVTDTDMELIVLSTIREAGLPEPVLHHRVDEWGRFVAEVDLCYPDLRIAIECDGSIHLDAAGASATSPARTIWSSPAGQFCASRGTESGRDQIASSQRSAPPSTLLRLPRDDLPPYRNMRHLLEVFSNKCRMPARPTHTR